jgi:DNA end-binding protein Ku
MAARSIGTATISFGLVSIPVRLFSATQAQSAISFNLLHATCGGRLKQQYICPRDNDMKVERDQMVKGYEFAKDRYVTFTPEELKSLEEKATQSIDIAEFVPSEKIDPIYYDKAYYLGPDKGGDRAYRLLSEAMLQTGRTALARYAARGKQYLVQLRPVPGGGLVLQQLLYKDEVRSFDEVDLAKVDVKEQELKLAKAIVEQISHDDFKPEQYEDDVKKRINEQIQRKVEGQEIQAAPEQPQTQIIDLMEALKASLANREKGTPQAAPAHAPLHAAPPASSANGEKAAPKLQAVPPPEEKETEIERKPAKRAPREKAEKAKQAKK